tara:strand:+ start:382 stop:771 length:390 start_codon:yes stop_codon:yes gene_type:complete
MENMKIKISTRLVILLPNIVLKFPLSRRGYLQSKNEKVIWGTYKNIYPLGTLYWEFLGIVCMKRYKSIDRIPNSTVMSVKATINEFDIDRCDLHNSKNWGTEDGVYYLIDYGISQYISTLYKKSEVETK